MTSLDTLQAQLKADMDAKKAKWPFPGGWREDSAPLLEEVFCRAKRKLLLDEALQLTRLGNDAALMSMDMLADGPDTKVVEDELFAKPGWLREKICPQDQVWAVHTQRGDIRTLAPHEVGNCLGLYLHVNDFIRTLQDERRKLKSLLRLEHNTPHLNRSAWRQRIRGRK